MSYPRYRYRIQWEAGAVPESVTTRIQAFAAQEVEYALHQATKEAAFFFSKDKRGGWRVVAAMFDNMVAEQNSKAFIETSVDGEIPPIAKGRTLTAEDFSDADAFVDHLQWCLAHAAKRVNNAKRKAGVIP